MVSFGVGVLVSAARAAKAKRREKANGAMIFVETIDLSMSKNGPSCSAGQYRISNCSVISLDHGESESVVVYGSEAGEGAYGFAVGGGAGSG